MELLNRSSFISQLHNSNALNEKWYHNLTLGLLLGLNQITPAIAQIAQDKTGKEIELTESPENLKQLVIPASHFDIVNSLGKGKNASTDAIKIEYVAALIGYDRAETVKKLTAAGKNDKKVKDIIAEADAKYNKAVQNFMAKSKEEKEKLNPEVLEVIEKYSSDLKTVEANKMKRIIDEISSKQDAYMTATNFVAKLHNQ